MRAHNLCAVSLGRQLPLQLHPHARAAFKGRAERATACMCRVGRGVEGERTGASGDAARAHVRGERGGGEEEEEEAAAPPRAEGDGEAEWGRRRGLGRERGLRRAGPQDTERACGGTPTPADAAGERSTAHVPLHQADGADLLDAKVELQPQLLLRLLVCFHLLVAGRAHPATHLRHPARVNPHSCAWTLTWHATPSTASHHMAGLRLDERPSSAYCLLGAQTPALFARPTKNVPCGEREGLRVHSTVCEHARGCCAALLHGASWGFVALDGTGMPVATGRQASLPD